MSDGQSVAIVGCGYWGRNLVRNFSQLGALGAIHDADAGLAETLAADYGVPAFTLDDLLARSDISGVVIAAPAERHAVLAGRALAAGKHVFVEKPLALRLPDAEHLIALAENKNRILMVGHLLHYHPAFRKLQDMVAEGQLGRIRYIYSNRLNLGKFRREENVFWSFAPHDLSMILALAGEMPDSVEATGSCYLHKVVADVTTTHLTFPNGINAHVFVSWLHPFKEQKLIVVGEDGMAVFDDGRAWAEKLAVYYHGIEWRNGFPEPNKADVRYLSLEEAEPLQLECQHFLDCMRDLVIPTTDGAEGLRVLQVLAAAEEAMSSGRKITPRRTDRAQTLGDRAGRGPHGVFIHESAYVDAGSRIDEGTRIWHFCHVYEGSRIGRNCTLGQNVMIGPDVVVGNDCKIQNNVSLYKGVCLEDGVFCGPSCVFTNVGTPRAEVERKDEFLPTLLRRGATIGANATIVCGQEIGAYSLVAAGAVVTHDVPPYAVVSGVPARLSGWVCECGARLEFQSDRATCGTCNKRFERTAETAVRRVD